MCQITNCFVIFGLAIGLILGGHAGTEHDPTSHGSRRDLSRYDKAGPFDIKPSDLTEQPTKAKEVMARVRGFLWTHWKEKRLGYLRATFYSIEGERSTSEFFVEMNSEGKWLVFVETRRELSTRPSSVRSKHTEEVSFLYDLLERIEPLQIGMAALRKPISRDEIREPSAYQLRLANTSTKKEIIL